MTDKRLPVAACRTVMWIPFTSMWQAGSRREVHRSSHAARILLPGRFRRGFDDARQDTDSQPLLKAPEVATCDVWGKCLSRIDCWVWTQSVFDVAPHSCCFVLLGHPSSGCAASIVARWPNRIDFGSNADDCHSHLRSITVLTAVWAQACGLESKAPLFCHRRTSLDFRIRDIFELCVGEAAAVSQYRQICETRDPQLVALRGTKPWLGNGKESTRTQQWDHGSDRIHF